MSQLGNLIKSGREGANLTQDELAIKLGLTQQTVSRWEAGKIMPPMERIPALASAIQVKLDELLAAGAQSAVERQAQGGEPEPTRMEALGARVDRIEEMLAELLERGATKRVLVPVPSPEQAPGPKKVRGQARRRQG